MKDIFELRTARSVIIKKAVRNTLMVYIVITKTVIEWSNLFKRFQDTYEFLFRFVFKTVEISSMQEGLNIEVIGIKLNFFLCILDAKLLR